MKLKSLFPDAAAIVVFIAITVTYFFTPISEGMTLSGHDNTAGIGAGHERAVYNNTHSTPTYWTNALFGGMPTYQIGPSYPSTSLLGQLQKILGLWMPQLLTYVFLLLLGAYIMLRAFNFRPLLASLGAIVWAFSSYFFIIIGAGHLWKVYALAYLPALIGGVVLCLRGRLLPGGVLTAIFAALEINANHPQMTYYFLPVIAVVTVCEAIDIWKSLCRQNIHNPLRTMAIRCAVIVIAGLLGVAINITSLYHTYEYSRHTMRGGSELSASASSTKGQVATNGLDRDYITQWSYGIDETWSLLVPKINGGSSMELLSQDETAMEHANPSYKPIYQSLTQYFGDQPFTAGPVYVGAITLLLALLAMIICRGAMKWGLLVLTLLSIALSWGHNFMALTDLFIDYVPLYSKFRTVSSILVVAEFCIPLLAVMALATLNRRDETEHLTNVNKKLFVAMGVCVGITALIALVPDLFVTRFVSTQEMRMLEAAVNQGYIPNEMLIGIVANIEEMRRAVVSADAWRSCGFIIAAIVALLLYIKGVCRYSYMLIALIVLSLVDMWTVNKRYLNDSMFARPKSIEQTFAQTDADKVILQDTALNYRVLNIAGDTFNENQTSYWHKSVGGYHAAKLQRYQDLIEHYIRPQIGSVYDAVTQQAEDSLYHTYDIINLLNTRWFILPLKGGDSLPLDNPYAMGNAWFVNNVKSVANADEALDALGNENLRTTAILEKQDYALGSLDDAISRDITDNHISLTDYQPNALTYKVSGSGGLAVLSEIYYPGWSATLDDGTCLPLFRVDYVLRAIVLPPGNHTLTVRFDPESIHTTESIAWTAWAILALSVIAALALRIKPKSKKKTSNN